MTELFTSLVLGCAVLITAFFLGINTEKTKQKLKETENNYESTKLAKAIKEANDAVPDNDLRKWLHNNSKK